jgi:hypothetical protein
MDRITGSLCALVLAVSLAAFGCGGGGSDQPDAYVPECTSPTQCPGTDTTCEQRACTNGTCGMTAAAPGTACTEDGGNVCDGAGSCVECVEHEDCEPDYMCDTGASMCVADPCEAEKPCDDAPPPGECEDGVAVNYGPGGTCTVENGTARCEYDVAETDCAEQSQICVVEGDTATCEDLCDGVSCLAREDYCDDDTAVSYGGAAGECDWETGDCVYPQGDETIETCAAHQTCTVEGGTAECTDLPNCEEHGPCETPPAPHCSDDGVVTYAETGTCDDSGGWAVCSYEATTTACDAPPGDYCDNDTLYAYEGTGTCVAGGEGPACAYAVATVDCAAIEHVCEENGQAECVDMCDGVDCPPLADYCDDDTVVTYGGAAGVCDWETGQCGYEPTLSECGDGQICWENAEDEPACYPDPATQLCEATCAADGACGRDIDLCVELVAHEGAFCLHACETAEDCPEGYGCEQVTSVDGAEAAQCVPDRGYCSEPNCYLGANCDHPHCADHPACQPDFSLNFDFEDWTTSNPPPGFVKSAVSTLTVEPEDAVVNLGAFSAKLTSTVSGTQNVDLRASNHLPATPGVTYTLHQWYTRSGPLGFIRSGITFFDADGVRIDPRIFGPEIDEIVTDWREQSQATIAPEGTVEMKPFFRLRRLRGGEEDDGNPGEAITDDWAVTVAYDFALDPTGRDGSDAIVALAGDGYVSAGIDNAGVLYVSTDGADPVANHDRVLYVWVGGVGTEMVVAPWSKDGQAAGPADGGILLALVQEESNGWCEWLAYEGDAWVVLSTGDGDGTCTDVPGSVLAGIVDLAALLEAPAYQVPTWIAVASAGYATGDGAAGQLIPATQVPAGDGNGDVDPGETTIVHRARLLVGKIHD